MNNLGALYENGQGLRANPTEARVWYEKAAAGGYTDAQASVARLKSAGR